MERPQLEDIHGIRPNSTQVQDEILDTSLPDLSGTRIRALLVAIRRTLSWVADGESGCREEADWIPREQFKRKTGRSPTALGKAITSLIRRKACQAAAESRTRCLSIGGDSSSVANALRASSLQACEGASAKHQSWSAGLLPSEARADLSGGKQ